MDLIFLPVYTRGIEWFKTKNTRKCHKSKRNMCGYKYRKNDSVWAKFLQEFIFVDFRFFCVFREQSFAIRTERFFLLGTFVFTFAVYREPR